MKIEVSNPEFESCDDCIYSDDSEKVCIFRGCIHAVTQVKECYKPKQRTGKWIKLDMHHKCTACGQECYVPTCMGEPLYAYCPNCGAKMEEGDE